LTSSPDESDQTDCQSQKVIANFQKVIGQKGMS
jgi:hypothetical protein